jgi:hypothetical protein
MDLSAALRPQPTRRDLPTYEVVLEGVFLGSGFTQRYATICRNWHIGWLGLPLSLEEVPEEKCDRQGKSWTYWPLVADHGLWDRARRR